MASGLLEGAGQAFACQPAGCCLRPECCEGAAACTSGLQQAGTEQNVLLCVMWSWQ